MTDTSPAMRHKLAQAERLLWQKMEQAKREQTLQRESRDRMANLERSINNMRGYIQGLREGLGLPPPEWKP